MKISPNFQSYLELWFLTQFLFSFFNHLSYSYTVLFWWFPTSQQFGDSLKGWIEKPNFLYNGVTQLIRNLGFEIFDLRGFENLTRFCTSSVQNVVRTKSQLNKPYKYEGLYPLTLSEIQILDEWRESSEVFCTNFVFSLSVRRFTS